MKLGILCTMINGFGRKGYYNSQEIGLGRALVKSGHSVVIYKCVPRTERCEKQEVEKELVIKYLPVAGLGAHGYLKAQYLCENLDGLLCFSDNQLFLPHIYRYCKKNKICFVPYIGTAHGLWGDFRSKVSDYFFAKGTLKIYYKNKVLVKTEAAREELLGLGVKDTNIIVTPVGLDMAVLKKNFSCYDRNKLKEKYGFGKEDIVISSVARLQPEKRPFALIDIFLQVRDKKQFRLLIIGQGPLKEQLEAKIEDNHLETEVKMIDKIPYEQMWEIYHLSDYFLNLNQGEIFGMAIMEAVYYQTSVAASDALGPRFTLKNMKGHKICRNDQEIVDWLLEDYPSQEELRESARKAEEKYSWDTCANVFIRLVKQKK